MIQLFLDNKRKKIIEITNSLDIDINTKNKYINEYNDFIKNCVQFDESGKLILTSRLISELNTAIKNNEIPLIIEPEDLYISFENVNNKLIINSLQDIVACHISKIPFSGDTIRTMESTGLTNNIIFKDPSSNIIHSVPYNVGNDTIHFTLNCAVHNHESGNDWNNYEYGVLTSLTSLDKSKILDVKSEDTYIDGDVKLNSKYYLFCPVTEVDKLSKENPNAIVVGCNGVNVSDAISFMIILTGHKLEPYGTYGWGKNYEYTSLNSDASRLEELSIKENLPVLKGQFGNMLHSETKYMARRMWKREYDALINLIEYNIKNNIDMPDTVLIELMKACGAYSIPGTISISFEIYKEYVFPILEKYGYKIDDSIFAGLVDTNEMKYIYYSFDSNIPILEFPEWENQLRNRVIKLIYNQKLEKINNESTNTK